MASLGQHKQRDQGPNGPGKFSISVSAEGRQTGSLQWRNFVIPKERQIQRQSPDRSLQRVTGDFIDKKVLNKTNNKRQREKIASDVTRDIL